jgi:hypothetical protein
MVHPREVTAGFYVSKYNNRPPDRNSGGRLSLLAAFAAGKRA